MSILTLKLVVQAHADKHSRLRKRTDRRLRPVKPDVKNELWYKAQLLAIVRLLQQAVAQEILPALEQLAPMYAAGDAVTVADSLPRRSMESSFARVLLRFGGMDTVARRLAVQAVTRSKDSVDDRLAKSVSSSLGVDIRAALTNTGPIASAMQQATTANVDLIKSIPAKYFERVEKTVFEGMAAGRRYESLVEDIQHIGAVTESRAKLIARDQTSKMNSAFNQVRQTALGLKRYRWRTAGDERVRDSHAENDGKTFSWDDPPEETGHPGEDVNCRCIAEPIFDLDDIE